MTLRIAFVCLSLAALGACSAPSSDGMGRDAPVNLAGIDPSCSAISSTGDMYRYCLQVGPDQALLEVEGTGTSNTALAIAADRRR